MQFFIYDRAPANFELGYANGSSCPYRLMRSAYIGNRTEFTGLIKAGGSMEPNRMQSESKVLFALLVHEDEEVLAAQLENIKQFNKSAEIVLYNGGTDGSFGERFQLSICPYSRPLKWGFLAPYLWDVMRWLEELRVPYDYLVNLDSDMLFIKHGFAEYLDQKMKNADCMGWHLKKATPKFKHSGNYVIRSMWKKWEIWQPFFHTSYFLRYFNPGQVYRHSIVRRMLSSVHIQQVEHLFQQAPVFALEEMFFVTLSSACGGRVKEYPRDAKRRRKYFAVRGSKAISSVELEKARWDPHYYWVHPVKGSRLIRYSRRLRQQE